MSLQLPITRSIMDDSEEVMLVSDFKVKIDCEFELEILCKAGFCFSGSFPNFLVPLLGSKTNDPTTMVGYLFHDLIYASRSFNRRTNDKIMINIHKKYNCGWFKRGQIYLAVRQLGYISAYTGHTRESILENREYCDILHYKNIKPISLEKALESLNE